MRELTEEERKVLDLIPQDAFMHYAAGRIGENRPSKRSCGHWKEYYPYCKVCNRSELAATREVENLAKQYGKEPGEIRRCLVALHRKYERCVDGELDFPGYVLSELKINRKQAVQLIRAFGV